MRARTSIFVVLVCFAALVVWIARTRDGGSRRTELPPSTTPALGEHERESLTAVGLTPPARTSPTAATNSASALSPHHPLGRVIGRTVDEAGTPIANVEVAMHWAFRMGSVPLDASMLDANGKPHDRLTVTTGNDGTFAIEARVPSYEWIDVDFDPPIHCAQETRHFGPSVENGLQPLGAGEHDLGDVVLAVRGAASGRVVTESGAPIADASISAECGSAEPRGNYTRSDAQGRFVLGHLRPGHCSLSVVVDHHFQLGNVPVDVQAARTTAVPDLVVKADFSITGSVVDVDGVGLAGITVNAKQDNRESSAITRDDGTFHLWFEHKGACSLDVVAPGFDPWLHDEKTTFDVGTSGVRIVLESRGEITFRVVDARTLEPIERFGLTIHPEPTPPDHLLARENDAPLANHSGGSAKMHVPHAHAFVVVQAPGHATLDVPVVDQGALPDEQLIALQAGSSLRGRALLAGRPASAAKLVVTQDAIETTQDPRSAFARSRGYTGGERVVHASLDGSFVFDDLSAGTYVLQIMASGAGRTALHDLIVPIEGALDVGDVALVPGAIVRGVVVTGRGESAEGFVVTLDRNPGEVMSVTDAKGAFEIAGVFAGAHGLTWRRRSETPQRRGPDPREQELVLVAGETREVSIDASSSSPCKLVVNVVQQGLPLRGIQIQLRIPSTSESRADTIRSLGTSDAQGRVECIVAGDLRFDLRALSTAGVQLGTVCEDVGAVPGELVERTAVIHSGRLVIQCPATVPVPEGGWTSLRLSASGRDSQVLYAYATHAADRPPLGFVWDGPAIDFGDLPVGECQVSIGFEAQVPDEELPGRSKVVGLHDPYATTIRIEDGVEARIVVP